VTDVESYALRLADDALILAHRLSEWVAKAPEIEEDIALANIGLDLLGQARALLSYVGDEDDLAYLRAEHEFTNCLLVEQPNGDFADTIARQLFFTAYQLRLYQGLTASTDPTLAAVAAKAVKEVTYHREHAVGWTLRLGDGTGESHRRMQRAVDRLWPYAGELFAADPVTDRLSAAGIAVDPAALEPGWRADIAAVLAQSTVDCPAAPWHPGGGRAGRHSEHLGYLLAEMQYLHRLHPGATW
jgi:ring-1,2-phenylacetyl-CoA epoxidase subunit PaaC